MSNTSYYYWTVYNGQLVVAPKLTIGTEVETVGNLISPEYDEDDLDLEIVSVVDDAATEVIGPLDSRQTLIKLRVLVRLSMELRDLTWARFYREEAMRAEHELRSVARDMDEELNIGVAGVMKADLI